MFVQNAMQDKTSRRLPAHVLRATGGSQPLTTALAKHGPGDGRDTPYHAGYWNDQSIGMLDYFFASNYQAAGATAGDGSNDVKDILVGRVQRGCRDAADQRDFRPGGRRHGTDRRGGQGRLLQRGRGQHQARSPRSSPTAATAATARPPLDASLTSIQQQWADGVTTMWQQSGSKPGHPSFLPGPRIPRGTWSTTGCSTTATRFPTNSSTAANFMNSDGSVKSTDEIAKDPKALAAYNAWLQDPAISAQQAPAVHQRSPAVR